MRMAMRRRRMEKSLGNRPATRVRRLTSHLMSSQAAAGVAGQFQDGEPIDTVALQARGDFWC